MLRLVAAPYSVILLPLRGALNRLPQVSGEGLVDKNRKHGLPVVILVGGDNHGYPGSLRLGDATQREGGLREIDATEFGHDLGPRLACQLQPRMTVLAIKRPGASRDGIGCWSGWSGLAIRL